MPPDRSQSPPLRALRTEAKCPVCGKPADAKYRPFCGKRCANIDLGRWLKEGYRVPTEETPDSELPEVGDGNEGRSGQEG